MPEISVQVQGLAELQKRLDDLRTEQQTKILRKGLRAAAQWIQQAIIERAPVRTPEISGTALPPGALKFDIVIRTISRGVPEGGAAVTVGPGKYTAHVARWVEFGHRLVRGGRFDSRKKRGPGKVVGQVEAHPFERPAYEESRDAALSAFQRTVKEELDKLQTPGGK